MKIKSILAFIKDNFWKNETENKILKSKFRMMISAMFICPSRHYIVAPYDGKVDTIVDSSKKRIELKLKYKDWLSERENGL